MGYLSVIINIICKRVSAVGHCSQSCEAASVEILTSCSVVSTNVSEHINRERRETVLQQPPVTTALFARIPSLLFIFQSSQLRYYHTFCFVCFVPQLDSRRRVVRDQQVSVVLSFVPGYNRMDFTCMLPVRQDLAHFLLPPVRQTHPRGVKPTFVAQI